MLFFVFHNFDASPLTIPTFISFGACSSSYGGALKFNDGYLAAQNLTFSNNQAFYGGAVYGYGSSLTNCAFTDIVFTGNKLTAVTGSGSAVGLSNRIAYFSGCSFRNNQVQLPCT